MLSEAWFLETSNGSDWECFFWIAKFVWFEAAIIPTPFKRRVVVGFLSENIAKVIYQVNFHKGKLFATWYIPGANTVITGVFFSHRKFSARVLIVWDSHGIMLSFCKAPEVHFHRANTFSLHKNSLINVCSFTKAPSSSLLILLLRFWLIALSSLATSCKSSELTHQEKVRKSVEKNLPDFCSRIPIKSSTLAFFSTKSFKANYSEVIVLSYFWILWIFCWSDSWPSFDTPSS